MLTTPSVSACGLGTGASTVVLEALGRTSCSMEYGRYVALGVVPSIHLADRLVPLESSERWCLRTNQKRN